MKRFIPFPKVKSPKLNVLARQEIELSYSETTGQHFIHYTTWSLPATCGCVYLIIPIYNSLYKFVHMYALLVIYGDHSNIASQPMSERP